MLGQNNKMKCHNILEQIPQYQYDSMLWIAICTYSWFSMLTSIAISATQYADNVKSVISSDSNLIFE